MEIGLLFKICFYVWYINNFVGVSDHWVCSIQICDIIINESKIYSWNPVAIYAALWFVQESRIGQFVLKYKYIYFQKITTF